MHLKPSTARIMERNIVIFGMVGSGKRTLANHICGIEMFSDKQGSRVLGARSAATFDGKYKNDDSNVLYRIFITDTESIHTVYKDPFRNIRGTELKTIHSIIFVIAHGRYTDESHTSLLHVVSGLNQQAKSISALVITHCEGMQQIQRKDIMDEFSSNPRGSRIVSVMEKGTYTVGFVDVSTCPTHIKPLIQEGIDNDEKSIRAMLYSCNSPVKIEDLSIITTNQEPTIIAGVNNESRALVSPLLNQPTTRAQPHAATPAEPETALLISIEGDTMEVSTDASLDLRFIDPKINHPNTVKSVLILGKVGSGKRTLGNHIYWSMNTAACETLFFCNTTNSINSAARKGGMFFQNFTKEDVIYNIFTIDTESLTQGFTNPIPLLKDRNIENINLIIFVIPNGIYTDESHGSLTHTVCSINKKATAISALVITHCEGILSQERDDSIAEFRANDRCARIAAFMGRGIYTVGFPHISSESKIGIEHFGQQIKEDEETIRRLVNESEKSVNVQDLLPPEKGMKPYVRADSYTSAALQHNHQQCTTQ